MLRGFKPAGDSIKSIDYSQPRRLVGSFGLNSLAFLNGPASYDSTANADAFGTDLMQCSSVVLAFVSRRWAWTSFKLLTWAMYVEHVAPEHVVSHAFDSGMRPASLRTRKRKLFVLIAVPRHNGKMNASGPASAL